MEKLTYKEKIAILRILTDIINADNQVHEKEINYMNVVACSFELTDDYKHEVNNLVTLEALSIIKELPIDVKEQVAQLMGKMIVVDEDINYNEVKLYNAVCESCNINSNFNMDDYPECTQSGPFINPEDI